METLLGIEEEHMRDAGMPSGHIVKLKRRVHAASSESIVKLNDACLNNAPLPGQPPCPSLPSRRLREYAEASGGTTAVDPPTQSLPRGPPGLKRANPFAHV